MHDERLPDTIAGLKVGEDGVLSRGDVNCFPWYTKEGYLGGTVRYRLIAEDIDAMNDLFCKTQETQQ